MTGLGWICPRFGIRGMEEDATFEDHALGFLSNAFMSAPRGPASIVHARTGMPYEHTPGGRHVRWTFRYASTCRCFLCSALRVFGCDFVRTTSLGGERIGRERSARGVYTSCAGGLVLPDRTQRMLPLGRELTSAFQTRHDHLGLSIASSARGCPRGQSSIRSLAVAYSPAPGYPNTHAGRPHPVHDSRLHGVDLPQRLCFRPRCIRRTPRRSSTRAEMHVNSPRRRSLRCVPVNTDSEFSPTAACSSRCLRAHSAHPAE